jgi:hypothetical protein
MTEFEFLSVMISIIFGLGLTHVLAGTMRYIYAGRATELRLVYSLFALFVLVLNWWVIFTWRGHADWSFEEFLVLVFWAISHYLLAITLYPPEEGGYTDFEAHRRWFLWAFVGMAVLDISQTAMRGDLFRPWYYLLFVLHYMAAALIAIFVPSTTVQRVVSWWFLFSIVTWALVVRRFLA